MLANSVSVLWVWTEKKNYIGISDYLIHQMSVLKIVHFWGSTSGAHSYVYFIILFTLIGNIIYLKKECMALPNKSWRWQLWI